MTWPAYCRPDDPAYTAPGVRLSWTMPGGLVRTGTVWADAPYPLNRKGHRVQGGYGLWVIPDDRLPGEGAAVYVRWIVQRASRCDGRLLVTRPCRPPHQTDFDVRRSQHEHQVLVLRSLAAGTYSRNEAE